MTNDFVGVLLEPSVARAPLARPWNSPQPKIIGQRFLYEHMGTRADDRRDSLPPLPTNLGDMLSPKLENPKASLLLVSK
jgi:hypothetical protein